MTTQPIRPRPGGSSYWHADSSCYGRGYVVAGVRAALIALVLLALLVFIALL